MAILLADLKFVFGKTRGRCAEDGQVHIHQHLLVARLRHARMLGDEDQRVNAIGDL